MEEEPRKKKKQCIRKAGGIASLPDDIHWHLIEFIPIDDFKAVDQTCRDWSLRLRTSTGQDPIEHNDWLRVNSLKERAMFVAVFPLIHPKKLQVKCHPDDLALLEGMPYDEVHAITMSMRRYNPTGDLKGKAGRLKHLSVSFETITNDALQLLDMPTVHSLSVCGYTHQAAQLLRVCSSATHFKFLANAWRRVSMATLDALVAAMIAHRLLLEELEVVLPKRCRRFTGMQIFEDMRTLWSLCACPRLSRFTSFNFLCIPILTPGTQLNVLRTSATGLGQLRGGNTEVSVKLLDLQLDLLAHIHIPDWITDMHILRVRVPYFQMYAVHLAALFARHPTLKEIRLAVEYEGRAMEGRVLRDSKAATGIVPATYLRELELADVESVLTEDLRAAINIGATEITWIGNIQNIKFPEELDSLGKLRRVWIPVDDVASTEKVDAAIRGSVWHTKLDWFYGWPRKPWPWKK